MERGRTGGDYPIAMYGHICIHMYIYIYICIYIYIYTYICIHMILIIMLLMTNEYNANYKANDAINIDNHSDNNYLDCGYSPPRANFANKQG